MITRGRSSLCSATAVLVSALGLAACGGNAAAGGTPGVLRYAFSVESTLDPAMSPAFNQSYLTPVYESLLTRDAQGRLIPDLATQWKLSGDGKTFDLTLRKGVTFQDGTPFDAEAVKTSLERDKKLPGSLVAAQLSVVKSVEPVDSTHVRLHLSGLPGAIGNILASEAGMMISPKAIKDKVNLAKTPVGTGPYKLAGSSDTQYTYTAWNGYWNRAAVKNKKFVYVVEQDASTRLRAVLSGQLDIGGLDGNQIQAAKQGGATVVQGDSLNDIFMEVNPKRVPQFTNPLVRQALTRSIDRPAIEKNSSFAGACTGTVQPFPKGYWGHVDALDSDPALTYNVAAAKQLLAKAGLPHGFSFTLTSIAYPSSASLAQILQAQLAKVGIKVKVSVQDTRSVQAAQIAGKLDAVTGQYPAGRPDPSSFIHDMYMPDGIYNWGKTKYPNAEALFDKSLRDTDTAKRAGATQQLISNVTKNGPAYQPICSLKQTFAVAKDVKGFKTTLLQEYPWQGISVS